MRERCEMIGWIRGEIIGPARPLAEPDLVNFHDTEFVDPLPFRQGPLAWLPDPNDVPQEVLYFERESPSRKYGAGILHPESAAVQTPDQAAMNSIDPIGADPESDEYQDLNESAGQNNDDENESKDDRIFYVEKYSSLFSQKIQG